jgi:hypothetical protein
MPPEAARYSGSGGAAQRTYWKARRVRHQRSYYCRPSSRVCLPCFWPRLPRHRAPLVLACGVRTNVRGRCASALHASGWKQTQG